MELNFKDEKIASLIKEIDELQAGMISSINYLMASLINLNLQRVSVSKKWQFWKGKSMIWKLDSEKRWAYVVETQNFRASNM